MVLQLAPSQVATSVSTRFPTARFEFLSVVCYLFISNTILATSGDANPDCTLLVPNSPLTATGLATPYQLIATNAAGGTCHQANTDQSAFVQGVILDQDTGAVFVYNPLVIDFGSKPAIVPLVPKLPRLYIVGLWFGTNNAVLRLAPANRSLTGADSLEQGSCVSGGGTSEHSPFGQFAHCNGVAFFAAARRAIQTGRLIVPPLGLNNLGVTCPTTRDFSVVDQDPSDNVITSYLLTNRQAPLVAQDTPMNRKLLGSFTVIDNGSDNRLLSAFIDPAIGCKAWSAPDLADSSTRPQQLHALALNEIQAALYQPQPQALVQSTDPMSLRATGAMDLNKLNAYRVGVNEPASIQLNDSSSSPGLFCKHLYTIGAPRIFAERLFTINATTVDAGVGTNLFTFLVARFDETIQNIACTTYLNLTSPWITTMKNDVVRNATIDMNVVAAAMAIDDTTLTASVLTIPPLTVLQLGAMSMTDLSNTPTGLGVTGGDGTVNGNTVSSDGSSGSGGGGVFHFDVISAIIGAIFGVFLLFAIFGIWFATKWFKRQAERHRAAIRNLSPDV